MRKAQKSAILSVVGILLGLGLCGLDVALTSPNNHDSIGGFTSFVGFSVILCSALALAASLVAMFIEFCLDYFRRRSAKKQP